MGTGKHTTVVKSKGRFPVALDDELRRALERLSKLGGGRSISSIIREKIRQALIQEGVLKS